MHALYSLFGAKIKIKNNNKNKNKNKIKCITSSYFSSLHSFINLLKSYFCPPHITDTSFTKATKGFLHDKSKGHFFSYQLTWSLCSSGCGYPLSPSSALKPWHNSLVLFPQSMSLNVGMNHSCPWPSHSLHGFNNQLLVSPKSLLQSRKLSQTQHPNFL